MLLEVKDLAVNFPSSSGSIKAIDGIGFALDEGESLGIVGESGSGKSMTALAILGLIPRPGEVVQGEIIFEGENLVGLPDGELRQLRGRKLAMILQDPMTSLNPGFTVGNQVGESIQIHRRHKGRALLDAVIDILRRVKIPAAERRVYDYPHQLSGGMRQRVVGAIMFSTAPKLLIADEPTTALDVTIQAQYLQLLLQLQKDLRFALIFISHDIGVVSSVSDKLAVMYAGRIVEFGTTEDVLSRPAHPYTQGLLSCIPDIDRPQDRLFNIPGQAPNPRHLPVGCRFAPRCTHVQEICQVQYPATSKGRDGHQVNCHFPVNDV